MAAVRAAQSNAMRVSLITFVALFVIATACAVIFYLKAEEFRGQYNSAETKLNKVANGSERGKLAKIVGNPESGKSYLGTMDALLNELVVMVTGSEPGEKPATVKVNDIKRSLQALNEQLVPDVTPAYGPNGIALLQTISNLKNELETTRQDVLNWEIQYQKLQDTFDTARKESQNLEQKLREESGRYQQIATDVQTKYDQLRQQIESSCEEQIQTYKDRLEKEQAMLRQKQLELVDLQAKLDETDQNLQSTLAKLEAIKSKPGITVDAFKPDTKIVRVDLQNDLVYLDAGTEDFAYRGLTFAVYDSSAPIPEDGKGKAEIEVFQVKSNVCVARILRSSKKNPIVTEDIVANLIWDPKTSNKFVVIGDFDLNQDGQPEPDGNQRIKEMILRWGGISQDDITVDTDFLVIGHAPRYVQRPTQDQMDVDPLALERYNKAQKLAEQYDIVLEKAGRLSVPSFNQKQFYYLIGYEALANKN